MKFCSVIITYYNNEYLFFERQNHNFVPPCGSMEKSEDPRDCAIRELLMQFKTDFDLSKWPLFRNLKEFFRKNNL